MNAQISDNVNIIVETGEQQSGRIILYRTNQRFKAMSRPQAD